MISQGLLNSLKAIALAVYVCFQTFLLYITYTIFVSSIFSDVIYMIWMIALPLLAIFMMILLPIAWFLLVPGISKRLFLARFKPGALECITNHTGLVDIVQSKFELPEGVAKNEYGWFTFPRPTFKPLEGESPDIQEGRLMAERVILKKNILKDVGKPIWFGCADKLALVNPQTLAALEEHPEKQHNPSQQLANLRRFTGTLSKEFQKPLSKLIDDLEGHLHEEEVTYIDARSIRETLPQNHTQSQIEAIANNREQFGRRSQGKDVFKIALLLILGVVLVAIVLGGFYFLTQGGF